MLMTKTITRGTHVSQCQSVHHKSHMYWPTAPGRLKDQQDTLLSSWPELTRRCSIAISLGNVELRQDAVATRQTVSNFCANF